MKKLLIAASALAFLATNAWSQATCKNRGELDVNYCDENGDMVADLPKDPKKWKDPSTLVWAYTPVEDPAVYEKIFAAFTAHLATCTGKKVVFFQVQNNAAEIEAMRSGRLHVAGFSTGPTAFAVNVAGAVPFAVKGFEKEFQGYNLAVVVKASGPIQTLADLKGKKVAHTAPSSNSGNMAPRALFPALGVTPERDYTVVYSGKHDSSILGVQKGDYDAAPIASDVFDRMVRRGQIKESDFRIVYRSKKFPTSSFAYAHDLTPKLADKVLSCFYDYRFTPEMVKAFDGADRFFPINYKTTWEPVRQVAAAGGESFGKAAYVKEAEREAAAKKK